ncbi:glycoside hydrolase family 128 protein, partial [Aureobasidium melanogenum]
MRTTSGFLIGSAFLLQRAFGQTIITPTIVITTHVSACTASSSTGDLFGTTSAASDFSLSQSLIPSGFVLSSIAGSVTLGSSSPLGVPSASAATSSLVASPLSASSISSATPSAVPVCGQPYSGGNGMNYQIACGQTYSGDVITPGRKRQQSAPSFEACIASCADLSECVASAFLLGECTLLSAIDSIINTEGAVAAIRADYVAVLAALASPSTVTTATVPSPTAGTAIIGYSSAIGEHLSQRISDNAPVPTSDNTVVYVTPNTAMSMSSSSAAAFSSQISNYISQHLSEDAPLPTGPDTVVYTTSATSSEPSAITSIYISSTFFADYSFKYRSLKQFRCYKHFITLKQPKRGVFIAIKPCSRSMASSTLPSSASLSSGSAASTTSSSVTSTASPTPSSSTSSSSLSSSSLILSSSSSSSSSSPMSSSSPSSSSVAASSPSTSSAVSATPTPVRNFGKRGLSYNQANLTMPFSLSGQDSQVSWAYDWFYAPCSAAGVQSCGFNPALEFVPLLYNDDPNLLSQWPAAAQLAIDNGSTALFSFNEPDFCQSGSACMNVSTAVYYHQQYMQPFAGKALIGAPAVTNSGGTDADPMGLQYLQYFLGNCTGCTIDFINLHWYSNKYAGASYLEYYVNSARAVAAGRPIWITEFGLDSTYSYTDAELQAFLQEAMPWLDQQPDVARYAYFMDASGILIDSAGDGISGTGIVYNNFTNSTLQPNLYTS